MSTFLHRNFLRIPLIASALSLAAASTLAAADVCVTIDESRDMFSPQDRTAAVLILLRQFEMEGERVVGTGCPNTYVLSHVQLGSTITITLSGPRGQRDATALGMDDVPAVYNQMVRSLIRGVPMNTPGVTDRTNVSNTQSDAPNRVHSDSLWYFRLGYGMVFANETVGGPSIGWFGYRRELDSFGIDVSLFNVQYKSSDHSSYYYPYYYASGTSSNTGTWMKLMFLRFTHPKSDRSPYFGGGLSWSTATVDTDNAHWHGDGLQGEITGGWELGRASSIRAFLQVDAGLPFYNLNGSRYTTFNTPPYVRYEGVDERYSPSLTLSLGVGWQRGGK